MADNYKLTGQTNNRHTNWTTEIVLERDDDGNVTKSISTTRAAELTGEQKKKLEARGYKTEKVSKEEADRLRETAAAATDVTGTAPVFGDSEAPDQAASDDADNKK